MRFLVELFIKYVEPDANKIVPGKGEKSLYTESPIVQKGQIHGVYRVHFFGCILRRQGKLSGEVVNVECNNTRPDPMLLV